jgi:hypothetical protein
MLLRKNVALSLSKDRHIHIKPSLSTIAIDNRYRLGSSKNMVKAQA